MNKLSWTSVFQCLLIIAAVAVLCDVTLTVIFDLP